MYKKSSSFINGRPAYGWSMNYGRPNTFDSKSHFEGGMNAKVVEAKKNGLYSMSNEEKQRLIAEYLKKDKS